MLRHILLILLLVPLFVNGQNSAISGKDSLKCDPFDLELYYTADMYANMHGGIKKGTGYLGMLSVCVNFDTEKAGWWRGGAFYFHGASTHGDTPSATYIGDLQVASNIEAGNHLYVQELFYSQTLGNTHWHLGAQDLNAEFVVSESGGLFLNSSFGVPALLSYNLPVPIFPLTTVGVTANWDISKKWYFKAALYDGKPTSFDANEHNLGWHIGKDEGALMISETGVRVHPINRLEGSYKLGFIYHSKLEGIDDITGEKFTLYNYNYGMYVLCDQKVWQSRTNSRGLALFVQASVSPEPYNKIPYYLGGGFNLNGLIKKDGSDILGLAFAHADLRDSVNPCETAFEFSYHLPLGRHLSIQPDLQYIIHPSGTDQKLDNAWVGFCRANINF
jgi:porin